jgi:hypothetical protein
MVVALGAITATAAPDAVTITGEVGVQNVDASASSGTWYLRYTGKPAPAGYAHTYQWGAPGITCSPETTPTVLDGTLNVANMSVGDVAYLGLIDQGLLASGGSGYQSGAYLYLFKNTATSVRVGPTDGNLGGEIVQTFVDLPIPGDNTLDVNITIDGAADPNSCASGAVGANATGCVSITAEGQTRTDSYGQIKTLNNSGAYTHSEFSQGARPGWDDYGTTNVICNLNVNGCVADPLPEVKLTSTDQMVCDGGASLNVDFSNVTGLYGYEFKVSYDAAKAGAIGAFVNSWFNTVSPNVVVPPGWNGQCNAGVCKFAASLQSPATPLNGGGTVAAIDFSPQAAGTFNATVYDVVLSDIDGFPITTNVDSTPLAFAVCGKASVSGKVNLQGRLTPIDGGTITLIDQGNNFPPINATFDGNGNYSITNIPVMPDGSDYTIRAMHILYLGNQKTLTDLDPGEALTGQNTRLLGGDVDNSGLVAPANTPGVDMSDIACIGNQFGGGTGAGSCGSNPDNATDINHDSKTNIQDLSMAAGNYFKNPFQPW